jgi:hypothetical protein
MRKIVTLAITAILSIALCACSSGNERKEEPSASELGILTVTFDYEKQSGYASNQFAVWVEDMNGNLVQTLYATRYTANGGYKNRRDSIPAWVERSDLASMKKSETDAISGSTPKAGALNYTWNLTDKSGNTVMPGEYKFFVEGSLRWKNRVLYSGVIDISGDAVTVRADAEYFYEESDDGQSALSEASPENAMIGTVTASFIPADGIE